MLKFDAAAMLLVYILQKENVLNRSSKIFQETICQELWY